MPSNIPSLLGGNVPNLLPHWHFFQPAGRLIWSTSLLLIGIAIAFVWIKYPKRPNWPVAPVLLGAVALWLVLLAIFKFAIESTRGQLWVTVLVGLGIVVFLALRFRPEKTDEPSTWAASILGAVGVYGMMTLAYGVVPHEWLTFANSYLNWGKDTFFLTEDQLAANLPPIDLPRYILTDSVAMGIYVVFATVNILLFSMWQKRKAVETETVTEDSGEAAPVTGPFARFRRRAAGTSAYGRPVTTNE
jgi:hypothetical protein